MIRCDTKKRSEDWRGSLRTVKKGDSIGNEQTKVDGQVVQIRISLEREDLLEIGRTAPCPRFDMIESKIFVWIEVKGKR